MVQAARVTFETDAYEETAEWLERQQRTVQGLLEACDELAAKEGTTAEETRRELQEMAQTFPTMSRRFLLVATAI